MSEQSVAVLKKVDKQVVIVKMSTTGLSAAGAALQRPRPLAPQCRGRDPDSPSEV